MSKSLGNFITIRKILERCDPETFRFYIAATHYRSPINFSDDSLDQSRKGLERIRNLIQAIDDRLSSAPESAEADVAETDDELAEAVALARKEFLRAMDDDFSTPDALSAIFDLVRQANRIMTESAISKKALGKTREFLFEFGEVFGLNLANICPEREEDLTSALVEILSYTRQKLREKKDWALSDEIRNRLRDLDIVLEDPKVKSE